MKNIKLQGSKTLKELYEGSACTMLGYLPEELHLYIEELQKEGYVNEPTVYETTGSEINIVFELADPLPEDLNVFLISLDEFENISKFAVTLRFERGYRWFDDVINNRRREEA